jgi:hypothetical protein
MREVALAVDVSRGLVEQGPIAPDAEPPRKATGAWASLDATTSVPPVLCGALPNEAALQPEKRLMLAVLDDAIAVLAAFARSGGRRRRRLAAEVETWIAADDAIWPFSFANICETLGLDADCVRARLSPYLPLRAVRAVGRLEEQCADFPWSPALVADDLAQPGWWEQEGA